VYALLKAGAANRHRDEIADDIRQAVPESIEDRSMCFDRSTRPEALCGELAAEADNAATWRNRAVAGFVAGGVLTGAAAATYFLWHPRGAKKTALAVSPFVVGDARGARLELRF
jgi:hypothetical protein